MRLWRRSTARVPDEPERCEQCGELIPDGAAECTMCGAALPAAAIAAASQRERDDAAA